jgi:hypothetical protein
MTCRLPYSFEGCMKGVGCNTASAGATCETATDSTGSADMCVNKCTASGSCSGAGQYCHDPGWAIGTICITNPCDASKYFAACDAAATGDGLCVPVPALDYTTGAPKTIGVCYQASTTNTTGTCDYYGSRTSLAKLCPQGQMCEPVQLNAAQTNYDGVCRPICNPARTPNPAKACGTGSVCNGVVAIYEYYDQGATNCGTTTSVPCYKNLYTDFPAILPGTCDSSCNPLGTNTCTADALGNSMGCDLFDATNGYCTALMPGAGAAGAACGTSTDMRKECSGNLYCDEGYSGAPNVCSSFCNTATCSPSASCTSCQPSTSNMCYPQCFPTGFNMGDPAYCSYCCSKTCSSGSVCGTGTSPVVGWCTPP